jgi:hypothetical protein
MAHYKETEKGQGLFLTVNLSEQLVPGTFEHTLNKLTDKKQIYYLLSSPVPSPLSLF